MLKKSQKIFEFSKKKILCERTISDIYIHVYKISGIYPEKRQNFDILKVKTAIFHAVPCDFCIFLIFKFCPIRAVEKFSWVIFRALEGNRPKTHVPPPTPEVFQFNLSFNSWPWKTFSLNILAERLDWHLPGVSKSQTNFFCRYRRLQMKFKPIKGTWGEREFYGD